MREPFGDVLYYGPERLSERFADDEEAREKSGFADIQQNETKRWKAN